MNQAYQFQSHSGSSASESPSFVHPVSSIFSNSFGINPKTRRGSVGWIDSLAVLPQHRRKGIGTRLVEHFAKHFASVRWIGCVTPNPIAAFVILRVVNGKLYIGECNPPEELVGMINEIRSLCQDLRGMDFNPDSLRVRTKFHPSDTGDTREWSPPQPTEPPAWWSSLENLPSQYEALLIVDKSHEI